MRAIIILIVVSAAGLILLTIASCNCNGKRGNGHRTTEERTVMPFTKVSIEGVFPVKISQTGDKEFVKVEADGNLQNTIIVKNEGDELVIAMETKLITGKVKVFINVKDLRRLDFNSVGNLSTANTLKLDSLELSSESVGKIDLDIDAKYLHADLKSVGGTTLKGKVNEVRINNKSIGALSAFGLKANTLMIHNMAVGSTEVYADSAFYIRSSAVGTLYYKGPGVLKELKSDGVGRVQKKE